MGGWEVLEEAREGTDLQDMGIVSYSTWVLGNEFKSSARAVCTINQRPILLALVLDMLDPQKHTQSGVGFS